MNKITMTWEEMHKYCIFGVTKTTCSNKLNRGPWVGSGGVEVNPETCSRMQK